MGITSTYFSDYKRSISLFKSEQISNFFLNDLWLNASTAKEVNKNRFRDEILELSKILKDKSPEDLTWNYICDIVKQNESFCIPCAKLVSYLLTNNLYHSEYHDKLHEIKEAFIMGRHSQVRWVKRLFCHDKIREIFVFRNDAYDYVGTLRYFQIQCNTPIRTLLEESLMNDFRRATVGNIFFEHFEDSVGRKISTIDELNMSTYKKQLAYLLQFEKKVSTRGIFSLISFYRLVDSKRANRRVFHSSSEIPESLITRQDYPEKIYDGYSFHYYDNKNAVPSDDKWLLHINGYQIHSTTAKSYGIYLFNFSEIYSTFYKKIIKRFIWSDVFINFKQKYEGYLILKNHINFISKIKASHNYENPEESTFTIHDSVVFKDYLIKTGVAIGTVNTIISVFRTFFRYAVFCKEMSVSNYALDHLSRVRTYKQNNSAPIPDNHLENLLEEVIRLSCENKVNSKISSDTIKLYFVLIHLCVSTEFRISELCNLDIDCIKETENKSKYELISRSKTSHGNTYRAIITSATKNCIKYAIEITNQTRSECPSEELRRKIFIVKRQKGVFKVLRASGFTNFLKSCCDNIGIPSYTAANLRDAHMTAANRYLNRLGKSNVSLPILTGHTNALTPLQHYVKSDRKRHLESMFRLKLDLTEVKGRIKNFGENYMDKRHAVENNCGFCCCETCQLPHMIKCLLCKNFVTTPNHREYFVTMALSMDQCIQNSQTQHDREDAKYAKMIYVKYIEAIDNYLDEHNK